MKKILTAILVLMLTLSMLAACGGGSGGGGGSGDGGSSGGGSGGGDSNTPAPAPKPPRTVEVPDEPLSLTDAGIYDIVIEGKKYNMMDVTIKDFLNSGYSLNGKDDESRMVDAHSLGTDYRDIGIYRNAYQSFLVLPVNLTDNAVPLKDCQIEWLWFDDMWTGDFDISIVCNLGLGSAMEDVRSVFGEGFEPANYESRGALIYFEGSNFLSDPGRKIHFIGGDSGVNKIMFELSKFFKS